MTPPVPKSTATVPVKIAAALKKIIPFRLHPGPIIHRHLLAVCRDQIISGPFRGLIFPHSVAPTKYLLGTYELELNPLLKTLCRQPYHLIIDIGAELGYYAIGFALKNHSADIVAFETTPDCQFLLKQTAAINGVGERVTVMGTCDTNSLKQNLPDHKRCLIFMDCEGEELSLLNPRDIPNLLSCDILVELHEFVHRNIAQILRRRFSRSHRITEICTRSRNFLDLPPVFRRPLPSLLFKKYFLQNMNEKRPEQMRWFFLKAKNLK